MREKPDAVFKYRRKTAPRGGHQRSFRCGEMLAYGDAAGVVRLGVRDIRAADGGAFHTRGGFKDPVYRDLTDDMLKTAQHWKREGAAFEGICSGYLSSREQIDTVREIFELFTDEHSRPLRLVDPVMGDNGTLYGIFNKETAQSMTSFAKKRTF